MRTEKEIKKNLEQWYKINEDENNNNRQSDLTKTIINTLRWVLKEKPLVNGDINDKTI